MIILTDNSKKKKAPKSSRTMQHETPAINEEQ